MKKARDALTRKKSTGTRSDSAATTPNASDSDSDEDTKKSKSSRKTSKGGLQMPLLPQQLAMVARAVSEHRSDNSSLLEEENRSSTRRTVLPVLRLTGENVSLQKTPTENEQILLESVNKLTKRVGHLELSAANLRSDVEMLLAERRANGDAVVEWKAFVQNQQAKEGDTCNCLIDSCTLL